MRSTTAAQVLLAGTLVVLGQACDGLLGSPEETSVDPYSRDATCKRHPERCLDGRVIAPDAGAPEPDREGSPAPDANRPNADAAKSPDTSVPGGDTGAAPKPDAPPVAIGNRYVATGGSDSNPGTTTQPWRTIQHAIDQAVAGDVVIVRDGSYPETLGINNLGGTASAPIVFRAEHRWKAKINPASTSANGGHVIYIAYSSYVTFQDFEIVGNPDAGDAFKFQVNSSHNRLVGNNIHDVGVSDYCHSGAGVVVTGTDNVVDGNWIWNTSPLRSASFRCNQFHGIYANGGSGTLVTNNVVFKIWQGWGLHIYAANMSNVTLANNTVFNCGDLRTGTGQSPTGGGFVLDCYGGTCTGIRVSNNIFVDNPLYAIHEFAEGGTPSGNTYDHNLVWNGPVGSAVSTSITNTITADPQFVNYQIDGSGDYHLKSTSPAINSGVATGAPAIDFDGSARPQGGAFDIGAYEWH